RVAGGARPALVHVDVSTHSAGGERKKRISDPGCERLGSIRRGKSISELPAHGEQESEPMQSEAPHRMLRIVSEPRASALQASFRLVTGAEHVERGHAA